jgi:hypothetical protein
MAVWQDPSAQVLTDMFAYEKGKWLLFAAIISLLILSYSFFKENTLSFKDTNFVFLYLYIATVIISYILSINPHVSFLGYHEHYENVFILIAYIIIFIYTALKLRSENDFQALINLWMISISIMFFIGLLQALGQDPFLSNFVLNLITPAEYNGMKPKADSDTVRNVYQTLYHYNYVSFYAAIGIPFFLAMLFSEKKRKLQIMYLMMNLMLLINQFLSLSRNGFIGIIVGICIVVLMYRKALFKRWKLLLSVTILACVSISLFVAFSSNIQAVRLREGFASMFEKNDYILNSIRIDQSQIFLESDKGDLIINYLADSNDVSSAFQVTNYEDKAIELIPVKDQLYSLEGFTSDFITLTITEIRDGKALTMNIMGSNWYFVAYSDGIHLLSPNSELVTIDSPMTFGFKGNERFGSARGYIWSRSIPILFNQGLFGSGPDTFAFAFPQNDYVGKYNAYGTPYMLVDKPHNIYLNYGINTGILSLMLLLIFWAFYLFKSFKLLLKANTQDFYTRIGIASLAAVTAYLTSGIFNDTNLGVTPSFWVILGLGYAANTLIRANNTKDEKILNATNSIDQTTHKNSKKLSKRKRASS